MSDPIKTFEEDLIAAARQYRHNNDNSPSLFNPEGGFVAGYEMEAVDKSLSNLKRALKNNPEPTHYAVIDEHGEIVQAWKIAQYRSAEILCDNLIKAMSAHDHDTSGWTVKGVTVHGD